MFGKELPKHLQHVPLVGSDGKYKRRPQKFPIVQINDFSQEQIKAELQNFKQIEKISTANICPALHGGPLEYPKVCTKATILICEKWDICYYQLMEVMEKLLNGCDLRKS